MLYNCHTMLWTALMLWHWRDCYIGGDLCYTGLWPQIRNYWCMYARRLSVAPAAVMVLIFVVVAAAAAAVVIVVEWCGCNKRWPNQVRPSGPVHLGLDLGPENMGPVRPHIGPNTGPVGSVRSSDDADSRVSVGNTNHNDCWRVRVGSPSLSTERRN